MMYPNNHSVGVLTRGPGSQLINAVCFLVPDDDAIGNTVTHGLSWFRPRSHMSSKGVCEGTVLSCTRSVYSRGYKRGERGREAPKSLLEDELSVGSSDVGARSECVLCVRCNA